MPIVTEIIRTESDESLSFGNHRLEQKTKVSDYEHNKDLYKVKTYHEITKLERNGMFLYESVPGTSVNHFSVNNSEIEFSVEGDEDAQITLGVEEDTEYAVFVNESSVGVMKTNLSGKLVLSVELEPNKVAKIRLVKHS